MSLQQEQLVILAQIGYAHPGIKFLPEWSITALVLLRTKGLVTMEYYIEKKGNSGNIYRLSIEGIKRLDLLKSIMDI